MRTIKRAILALIIVSGIAVFFTLFSNGSASAATSCPVPTGKQSVKWYCPKIVETSPNNYTYSVKLWHKKSFQRSQMSNHTAKIVAEFVTPNYSYSIYDILANRPTNTTKPGYKSPHTFDSKVTTLAQATYKKYRGFGTRPSLSFKVTPKQAAMIANSQSYVEISVITFIDTNKTIKYSAEKRKVSPDATYKNTVSYVESPYFNQVKPQSTGSITSSVPATLTKTGGVYTVNSYEPAYYTTGTPTYDVVYTLTGKPAWFEEMTRNQKLPKFTINGKNISNYQKQCGIQTSSPGTQPSTRVHYVTGSQLACTFTLKNVKLNMTTHYNPPGNITFTYDKYVTSPITYDRRLPSWVTGQHPGYFPWSEAMNPIQFSYVGSFPSASPLETDFVPATNQPPYAYNKSLDIFYTQQLTKYRLLIDLFLTNDPFIDSTSRQSIRNSVCQPWVLKGYSQSHSATNTEVLSEECGMSGTPVTSYLTVEPSTNNPYPGFNNSCVISNIGTTFFPEFNADYDTYDWGTQPNVGSQMQAVLNTLSNLHNGIVSPEDNIKHASLVLAHYLNVKNKPAGATEFFTGDNATMLSFGFSFNATGIGCYVQ